MKLSPTTKARRRLERELRLRTKRYKGDHDYWQRVVRCPDGFRVTPYPHVIEPGIPIGMTQKDLLMGEFTHVFVEPLYWHLDENDQVVGPFAADRSPR
jgi:hypothetical protein